MPRLNVTARESGGKMLFTLLVFGNTSAKDINDGIIVKDVDHEALFTALDELAKGNVWLDKYLISCPTEPGGVMHRIYAYKDKSNEKGIHRSQVSTKPRNSLIATFLKEISDAKIFAL